MTHALGDLTLQVSHDGHEDEVKSSNYQMMKSHHGSTTTSLARTDTQSSTSNSTTARRATRRMLPTNNKSALLSLTDDTSFFYAGMDQMEQERKRGQGTNYYDNPNPTTDYSDISTNTTNNDLFKHSYSYFNHETRRKFVEEHALLNLPLQIKNDSDAEISNDCGSSDSYMDYDFTTLFAFGSSPLAREKNSRNHMGRGGIESQIPAIADIRKSSLSYIRQGRIEMRLPGDNIRLVMDEFLEPGILSVETDVECGGHDGGMSVGNGNDGSGGAIDIKGNQYEEQEANTAVVGTAVSGTSETDAETAAGTGSENEERIAVASLSFGKDEQHPSVDHHHTTQPDDATTNNRKKSRLFDNSSREDYTLGDDVTSSQNTLLQKLLDPKDDYNHDHRHNNRDMNQNNRPPDLRYVLTVDQNLYKRIFSELADSRMPCGLYFCCHDAVDGSKSVDISVAILILIVVFTLLFIGTCTWPTA